jgi:hypothetical protein
MVTEAGTGCQEGFSRRFFPVAIPQNLWHAYVVIAQEKENAGIEA